MHIFWIIYLVIGAILGCVVIYFMIHDETISNDEKEMNAITNNCGTIVVFIIGVLYALFIALLWPLAITYGVIKESKKKERK